MNHFRQSIIFFGFVLPFLAVALLVGGFAFLRSKVIDTYSNKAKFFNAYNADQIKAQAIEAKITKKRPHVANWSKIVRQETASSVSSLLNEIKKKLPAKEFQQTAFSPSNSKGLGSVSAQSSLSLDFSYRASFRSMQRALLELESQMPQLQLNAMSINRSPQSNTLNFKLTYTAWEE